MNWTLEKIAKICQGEIYGKNTAVSFNKLSIDTRTLNQDDLYIGIKGETYDGNNFYYSAFEKGACAAILNKNIKNQLPKKFKKPIIFVDDTVESLAKLARVWLDEKQIPVIAITGSVGKTSTRNMLFTIISKKYRTFKTIKNYNNKIGLPLCILNIRDEQVAILEMGMNQLEEITTLSKIAKPDIAIITNVLPVHIENLKTIENILKAKLEIVEELKSDGTLFINNDNNQLNKAQINYPNIFTCGIDYPSTLQITNFENNQFFVKYHDQIIAFDHPNLTKPFLQNLLLAIGVGLKFNVPIDDINDAIKNLEFTEGRLENIQLKNNILLINDAYNANTASMKNAIDYLNKQKGQRKIAIFGNMRELGEYSTELHAEVGKYITPNNLDYLLTIGHVKMDLYRKTYLNVYVQNIKYNIKKVINKYNTFEYYIGVVKADCYGHKGIKPIKAMIASGINYLAVVSLEEALYIRKYLKAIPILCIGVVNYKDVEIAIKNNITLIINSLETMQEYINVNTKDLKVHLKINTGANRLGIKTKTELIKVLKILTKTEIEVEGIYTHIYNAHNQKDTKEQIKLFESITKNIDIKKIPIRHIQASDVLYEYEKPDYVNACRLGIIMYGLIETDLKLKSTISLHSEIHQIYHLKKGENVGYEGIYHAPNDEIIAVISIGYADGIIRKNSGRMVYINDKPYPIIGNICMDYLFVRIDDTIKIHDEVIIIKDNNHINEIAKHLETISYEIITGVSSRVPRIYK